MDKDKKKKLKGSDDKDHEDQDKKRIEGPSADAGSTLSGAKKGKKRNSY